MRASANQGRHTNQGSVKEEGQEIQRQHQLKEKRVSQVGQVNPKGMEKHELDLKRIETNPSQDKKKEG
jgi:hypothetical protein